MFSYHIVKRRIKYFDESLKETVIPLENNGYKFELYAYDIFQLIDFEKFGLFEAKEDEIAMISYPEGSQHDTMESARNLLSKVQKKWIENSGIKLESNLSYKFLKIDSDKLFEISFRKIYDERDPNLKVLVQEIKQKKLVLPLYIE